MMLARRFVAHFGWVPMLWSVVRGRHRRQLAVLGLLSIVQSIFETVAVGAIMPIVALLTDPEAITRQTFVAELADFTGLSGRDDLLLGTAAFLATVFTLRFGLRLLAQQMRLRLQEGIRNDLSLRLLRDFLLRPYEFHLNESTQRLVAMVTEDTAAVSSLASQMSSMFSVAFTVTLVIVMMFAVDPAVTAGALALVCVISGATYRLQHRRTGRLGRKGRRARWRMSHSAVQALGSIRETRTMGAENVQMRAFATESALLASVRAKVALMQAVPAQLVEWLVSIALAGAVAFVALEPDRAVAVMPVVAAVFYGANRLMPAVMGAVAQMVRTHFVRQSLEAVYELLAGRPAADIPDRVEIRFERELALRGVTVLYKSAMVPALFDATLAIPRGAHVGIVGPSGAGKTTLVNALAGFLPPTEGEVAVDGRSIYDGLKSWQRTIGLVPQDAFLLDDSIRANIALGREYDDSDERLRRVLAAVRLDGFVAALPQGALTPIGERGARVSGGQRQRIAIARALYGDPEVIILDEATSSLDPEVAEAVDDAIASLAGAKTLIVIAHRFVSMVRCDFIVYLDRGRVCDIGPMNEVRARNAEFRRLVAQQDVGSPTRHEGAKALVSVTPSPVGGGSAA
jgi:ABC-type multidrug transport system fused ATPase/permease subunit